MDYKPSDAQPYSVSLVNPDEFATGHTVTLTGLEPGSLYHYRVVSKGIIGSEAKSTDFSFMTTSELARITDIVIKKTDQAAVNVSWKTSVPTSANLEYTSLKDNKTLTQGDTALVINHSTALKNLDYGVGYTLVIKDKDEFGNEV